MDILERCIALAAGILLGLCMAGCSGSGRFPDGKSRYKAFAPDGIPFVVAADQWKVDMRGHHRAVVKVTDGNAEAVVAMLPWRRPDLRIDTKKIIVTDSGDNEIMDVAVTELTPEKGEIIFRQNASWTCCFI